MMRWSIKRSLTTLKNSTATVKQILSTPKDSLPRKLSVSGWISTCRNQKRTTFLSLQDGTCFDSLQVILDSDILKELPTTGSSVCIQGTLKPSPAKGQQIELVADQIQVIGHCPSENYPLFKSRASMDYLREFPHLRPRTKTFGSMLRVRDAAMIALQQFFHQNDFIQVHTPILTSNDCEGGGEAFRVASPLESREMKESDPLTRTCNDTKQVIASTFNELKEINASNELNASNAYNEPKDFFHKPTYLTVSGQLHLEAAALSHSRVYTLNPCFRAEPSASTRHLAEFWMLEAEMAFMSSLPQLLNLIESMIHQVTYQLVHHSCEKEFEFFERFFDSNLSKRLDMFMQPFDQLTYTEAVHELKKSNQSFQFPVEWGNALQAEHERFLAEKIFQKPVFITDYPIELKPFYMKVSEDQRTVQCTDLIVPTIGELIGGSLREQGQDMLVKRIKEMKLDVELYDWYIDLRRYGTVPHGGFGMGFERYLAAITGMKNIKDLTFMPRFLGHCPF